MGTYACDECSERFTKYTCKMLNKQTHFCCRKCQHKSTKNGRLREITKNTNIERYGSTTPAGNANVQAKMVETNIKRYGVNRPTMSPIVQQKQRKTTMLNFGVPYGVITSQCRKATTSNETIKKRHEAMKRNKTYNSSVPEEMLHAALIERFGAENIVRQHPAGDGKWSIDFYVTSINTYIQCDGMYWHGLDRPIKEITKHINPRDAVIEIKHSTDIAQAKWFADKQLRLVRFTDKEIKHNVSACVASI